MKITKFRVKNYKSITDSGDCFLTDNVTILAGKNESGKTSLLEALEDFDADKTIRADAKPIKNLEALPEISITFEISVDILKEIFNENRYQKNTHQKDKGGNHKTISRFVFNFKCIT